MKQNSPKILVVGAGITGITLAALLEKEDVFVDLVEMKSQDASQGYGIVLLPSGMRIVRRLGLTRRLLKKGSRPSTMVISNGKGRLLRRFKLALNNFLIIDRNDLHQALQSRLGKTPLQYDRSITNLRQKHDKVSVTFTDGKVGEYDLVIGADGVYSVVRSIIFPSVKPQYSGVKVRTYLTELAKELPVKEIRQTWGDNAFMNVFPCGEKVGVMMNAALDETASVAEFFSDHHPDSNTFEGALYDIQLASWHTGRVILAGDAAHAMLPATSKGASAGMEDALRLATLIARSPQSNWDVIGKKYEYRRKRQMNRLVANTRTVTRLILLSGLAGMIRNTLLRFAPRSFMTIIMRRS